MVLVANPDGGKSRRPQNTGVPSHNDLTAVHLNQILGTIATLLPFVTQADGDTLEKGVGMSASTSFIKACNVLDDILDDKRRWSLDSYDKLEASLLGLHEIIATRENETRDAIQAAQRPCILLKPTIKQLPDGVWECRYGKGRGSLVGYGETPNIACLGFDAEFYGLQEEAAKDEKTDSDQKDKK